MDDVSWTVAEEKTPSLRNQITEGAMRQEILSAAAFLNSASSLLHQAGATLDVDVAVKLLRRVHLQSEVACESLLRMVHLNAPTAEKGGFSNAK